MKMKKGILLVNLGTPDSFRTADVRRYLRQFLMDGRVIDIPWLPRFLLVNGIIAPFRAPKSAAVYKKVWLPEGSPLKVYGMQLESKIQSLLGDEFLVKLGMRYQNPSMEAAWEELKSQVSSITIVPLFPQYASATSGSVAEEWGRITSHLQSIPPYKITGPFYQENFFLQPLIEMLQKPLQEKSYDQVLFSYHGLPERQIRKADDAGCCLKENCCGSIRPDNFLCYRAQCFETSRLIAAGAGLHANEFTTAFQSRLGKDPWIKPYTEETIRSWPGKGIKKVLVLSPSFVADCLETTEEIGEEYHEVFMESGGECWDLLPCLNAGDSWADGFASWIREQQA
jgi:ferrochelatase